MKKPIKISGFFDSALFYLKVIAEFSIHNLFGWRWIANQPLGWSILIAYDSFKTSSGAPAVSKQYALDHNAGFQ